MFISLTHDQVQFCYGSIRWQYDFNEIAELVLLKRKKTYILENCAFIAVTAFAYYCMLFTNVIALYYITPTLLCYAILIILRFHNKVDFEYYVVVKDIYKKEVVVKISASDRPAIGKQIDQYLNYQYDQIVQKTKTRTSK
ncbi:hypothetical protein SAMN05444397_11311 [Flavobacterium aquidurense]|uniref:Uncharacterized protein n=1 Tax=Flavobacterium frigidimaris TaxID=262320 RepID=A0ABX4BKV6_FLAFR|nr:hypothetical protein [Flavobacterium frigidimaris]OXA76468.1 hypothetical protein B0A65_19005 [Flavobacterium frigidimaris]SDZ64517.1 hypothetical protein SAMN05444397_11311 [Flavobacterium aquidurense]